MKKKKALVFAACVLLLAMLAAGIASALSGMRTEPENPLQQIRETTLNIDTISLQYNADADALDASFGPGGSGGEVTESPDSQSTGEETQQEEEPPEEAEPEQQEPQETEPEEPKPSQAETPSGKKQDIQIITGKDDPGWNDGGGDEPGGLEPNPEEPGGTDEPEEPDEPEEEEPVSIVTDLRNCTLSQDDLTDDTLHFYARIENGTDDMYLRIMLQNSETAQSVLTASGQDYAAKLAVGRNVFTILLKQNTQTLASLTATVMYQATMADAEHPERGEHPPVITTNLDGKEPEIQNRNFPLQVTAKAYDRSYIHANHIRVTLDGTPVTEYTGSDVMEYTLWLEAPSEGDSRTYKVTVQAWDDNGNSSYKEYILNYLFVDEGGVIGTATISIDATTVGLGYLESSFTYEIKQDEPASYAVAAALEAWGYSYENTGTLDENFYLSRVCASMIGKYAEPDPELWAIIERNGVTTNSQHDKNSLGEFDFTRGSGWMYAVNGYYPGVSLASYHLSDGDSLCLRFTLAWGRDIGGGASGGMGADYCGTWIGGGVSWNHTYLDGVCTCCGAVDPSHQHVFDEGVVTREPTCTEEGERLLTCTLCGETETEPIEKLPHTFENGRCTVCGAPDPDHTHIYTDHEETLREPTCTEPGEKALYCACGEFETEEIPARGHSFGETEFEWSGDYSSCKVRVTCMNPGCTEQIEMTVRAEDTGYTHEHYDATCTEAGYDLYRVRITLTVGEEERLCEKEILIPGEEALGHLFEQGYPTCLREGCSEPNPDYQPEPGEDGEAQKRKQTQTRSLRKR